MDLVLLGQLLGGLGLVLLGMELLTDGLKRASGPSLRQLISKATQSKQRAFATGVGVTALVQSSSAVTLATLGFVSAGLMSLGQALPLLFGSNIGTTLTGWLVALLGFKLKITAYMLPLIGLGVAVKLFSGGRNFGHYGHAIAGFGLFFLGLDFISAAFDGLSETLPLRQLGSGSLALLLFVVAGVVITVLTQSSSASMAIALSMLSTETISLSAACALVIGANIGTTTTALLGAIGSLPNAKRIALAHLVFNTQTAIMGVALLSIVANMIDARGLSFLDPVIALALFHTLFNMMGVMFIWPMMGALERWLQRRFVAKSELDAKPQFITKALLVTPDLAVVGINRELSRANQMSSALARAALSSEGQDQALLRQSRDSLLSLLQHIYAFNQQLAHQDISEAIAETLPLSIRVGRYIGEIGRLSTELSHYQTILDELNDTGLLHSLDDFKQESVALIDACEISSAQDVQGIDAHRAMRALQLSYQNLKHELLEKTVEGVISTTESAQLLEYLSMIRRLASQAEEASSHWSATLPMQQREALTELSN